MRDNVINEWSPRQLIFILFYLFSRCRAEIKLVSLAFLSALCSMGILSVEKRNRYKYTKRAMKTVGGFVERDSAPLQIKRFWHFSKICSKRKIQRVENSNHPGSKILNNSKKNLLLNIPLKSFWKFDICFDHKLTETESNNNKKKYKNVSGLNLKMMWRLGQSMKIK